MDPSQEPQPEQEPNEFLPPEPGQYQPQPHDELANEAQPTQEVPKPHFDVDNQIAKKKKQAKVFIIAAVLFSILFVVGIIVLAVSFSSEDELANSDLSIDEQLKLDANNLGLAIINYNNGNDPFEITPENAAQLSTSYIPKDFNDPRNDEAYTLVTSIPEVGEMQYILGGICNSDDSISQGDDPDGFAIRVALEDEAKLYCIEKSEIKQPVEPKP